MLSEAGEQVVSISFYNDTNTSAIAFERSDSVFINTAKAEEGAGSAGNVAHEFAHTLGFRHRFNLRLFSSGTVPYRVGELVESIVNGER